MKFKEEDQLLDKIDENLVMKALDGFLIILSTEGDVIYVSENIQEYIGIQQVNFAFRVALSVKSISNNKIETMILQLRLRLSERNKTVNKSLKFIGSYYYYCLLYFTLRLLCGNLD